MAPARAPPRPARAGPPFANPHGALLAPERRADVLAAVRAAGAFLIEDDPVRDFALEPRRFALPAGGMHLWVRLDAGEDDVALAERAYAAGVKVFPGRPWFPAEPPAPHLRLTFAAEPPDRLAEGMRLLAAQRRSQTSVRQG